MDKQVARSKRVAGKKAPLEKAEADTLFDSSESQVAAKTEEFPMKPSDEDAGALLVDQESSEAEATKAKAASAQASGKAAPVKNRVAAKAQATLAPVDKAKTDPPGDGTAKSPTAQDAKARAAGATSARPRVKTVPPEEARAKKTNPPADRSKVKAGPGATSVPAPMGETHNIPPPDDEQPPPVMQSTQHMPEGEAPPLPDSMRPGSAAQSRTEKSAAARPTAKPSVKPGAAAKPGARPSNQKSATVIGDYKLLKKLGQGGMGAVYKAQQISVNREVALKILSKELAAKPAFIQRFKREGKVMERLDHPNILRCYKGDGEDHGFHYIAIEFVDGGSVENKLKEFGKLEIGDALHITIAVARALQHAHELNMIHRDIKPDNILLTSKGVVKVADMGLAKATDEDMSLTKTGTGAGTPIFMAPEQARDVKHVDGRVDIYALGCMLYVLLTGEPPFKGETLVDLIEAKEKGKYAPVRQLNDDVPERLSLVIDKMMASKPEHRFKNCDEVVTELEKFGLHNEHLSFFARDGAVENGDAQEAEDGEAPAAKAPATPARKMPAAAARTASPPSPSMVPRSLAQSMVPGEMSLYHIKLVAPNGKTLVKKLTRDQITALIKNKAVDAETQLARSEDGPFRSLATYNEFSSMVRAQQTTTIAQKKGEKFKTMFDKFEKQDASRRQWRWLFDWVGKTGTFLSVIIWLLVSVAVLVGVFFAFQFLFELITGDPLFGSKVIPSPPPVE